MFKYVVAVAVMTIFTTAAVAETFAPESLTAGVEADEASCNAGTDRIWVIVGGAGDCIRYYASGLSSGSNEAVVVYLHGDRLWGDKPIAYDDNSAEMQQAKIDAFGAEIGLPFIMVARPGAYGSSGNHGNRRQARETQLVSEAIAGIRKRYQINKTGLTGQSGGGAVAAYVLTQQPDLNCVALTSAALSMKTIVRLDPQSIYDTTKSGLYNAIDHVADVKTNDGREIYVIGTDGDKFSPLENQKEYADALAAQGQAVHFLEGQAAGSYRHTLDRTGRFVTAWCLNGVPPAEIQKRVQSGEVKG